MPRKVYRVVNPWERYMDDIWEFTHEEFQSLPRFTPAINPDTGCVIGIRLFTWVIGEKVYTRFTDRSIHDWNAFWNGDNEY